MFDVSSSLVHFPHKRLNCSVCSGCSALQLSSPSAVVVDRHDNVYIVDSGWVLHPCLNGRSDTTTNTHNTRSPPRSNNRILRFVYGATAPSFVFGSGTPTTFTNCFGALTQTAFYQPASVVIHLWNDQVCTTTRSTQQGRSLTDHTNQSVFRFSIFSDVRIGDVFHNYVCVHCLAFAFRGL